MFRRDCWIILIKMIQSLEPGEVEWDDLNGDKETSGPLEAEGTSSS